MDTFAFSRGATVTAVKNQEVCQDVLVPPPSAPALARVPTCCCCLLQLLSSDPPQASSHGQLPHTDVSSQQAGDLTLDK